MHTLSFRRRVRTDQIQNTTTLALKNKLFITATKDGEKRSTIFTNYIRAEEVGNEGIKLRNFGIKSDVLIANPGPSSNYNYEMLHDGRCEFRTWEVARATSAAPTYFENFQKTTLEYWDGGLYNNNPARIAREEMSKIWPQLGTEHPDVLLSVGSGYQKCIPKAEEKPKSWLDALTGWVRWRGFRSLEALRDRLLHSLDSEEAWQDYYPDLHRRAPGRYIRLNPEYKEKLPELDDLTALEDGMLQEVAADYLGEGRTSVGEGKMIVQDVARRLLATTFYFESDQQFEETEDGWLFKGQSTISRCSNCH
jgi:predicted acylesterase/phospholipase RssA